MIRYYQWDLLLAVRILSVSAGQPNGSYSSTTLSTVSHIYWMISYLLVQINGMSQLSTMKITRVFKEEQSSLAFNHIFNTNSQPDENDTIIKQAISGMVASGCRERLL